MTGPLCLGWIGHSRVVRACRRDSNVSDVQDSSHNTEQVELLCGGETDGVEGGLICAASGAVLSRQMLHLL